MILAWRSPAAVDTGRARLGSGLVSYGFAPRGAAPTVVTTDIRAAVYAALLADPDTAAIIGARIYPSDSTGRRAHLPAAATVPALTFRVVTYLRPKDIRGRKGIVRARVQLDAWSHDLMECVALCRIIREKWDGFVGDLQGIEVTGAFVDDETDLTEASADGSDAPYHHIALDTLFFHRES